MTTSTSDQGNQLAVARTPRSAATASAPEALERREVMPWEAEGEFELDALIVNQSGGEILVKIPKGESFAYLTISGFLPGKVVNQRWHLSCLRESGRVELIDGEPILRSKTKAPKLSIVRIEDKKAGEA
jgi:hypothetical protein